MKWSFRIGRIGGIGIYLHVTFVMLIAILLFGNIAQGQPIADALGGVAFILILFSCVVLHELGHAFAAKHYGIRTRDITLLPIGGVARLERIPREPSQELVVALAGPAVNLVIAALLVMASKILGEKIRFGLGDVGFLSGILSTNLYLCGFNLLPAFPMDGGRVLRAILATRLDYARASDIAARTGQVMALLFAIAGLWTSQFLLVFIALFVYLGAEQEATLARVRTATQGLPVRNAMVTNFQTIQGSDPISHAIQLLLSGCQQDFPVLDGDQIRGILTRANLLRAVGQGNLEARTGDVLSGDSFSVGDDEMLEDVLRRMQANGISAVPVTRNGALVGLVTLENVGELLMVQSALRGKGRDVGGQPAQRTM